MYEASRWFALVLATAGPLTLAFLVVGDSPYWLDSAEFVGAAFALEPAHPPGHPLYILLGRAVLLLPIGTAAFRMNVLGGVLGATALGVTQSTCVRILDHGFDIRHPLAVMIPALGCALVGTSPAWLHQAIYAEVYTLQVLLTAATVHCAVRASLGREGDRERWWLVTAFVLGLSLTNHHLSGFLLLPALVASFTVSALQARLVAPARLFICASTLAVIALLVYALVPVRGFIAPSLLLGRVESLSDFVWLISAKVYQKSAGTGSLGSGDVSGVLFVVAQQIGLLMTILSVGGFYMVVRLRRTRCVGVLLVVAAATILGGRMLLAFDRTNPDVMGYLLFVPLIAVMSLTAFAGALHGLSSSRLLRVLLLVVMILVPGWGLVDGYERYAGAVRQGGEDVSRAQYEIRRFGVAGLPPGSVAVSTLYATCFLTWYGRVVEGERPDVRHVPLPFVGYRGEAAVLVDRWEELSPIVRGYLVTGALPDSEMAALAQDRPVYVEPEPLLGAESIQYLEPRGIFMAFRPEPVARRDFYAAADLSSDRIDALLGRGHAFLLEPQTVRYTLWWLYNRTLVLARRGYTAGSIRSADQALTLVPGVPEIVKLKSRLEDRPGPVENPAPYVPRP